MSDLFKPVNYLNAVLKSLRLKVSLRFLGNKLPMSDARHVNARLTNLCFALIFILTIGSTGKKSSEFLFTLTFGPYHRKTKALFEKRNMEHSKH